MARLTSRAVSDLVAKVIRFGCVGWLCSVCYAALLVVLRRFTGLSVETSHVLAFAAIIPVSYYLQKSFTFGYAGPDRRSLPRFLVASGAAWLVSTAGVIVAKDLYGLNDLAIIAIVFIVVPGMSFATMLLWVFIERKPADGAAPRPKRATRQI